MYGTVGPGGTSTWCSFRVKFIGGISWCYFVPFISSRLTHYFLLPFFGNTLQSHKKVTIHGLAGGRLILTEEEFLDEVTSKVEYWGREGEAGNTCVKEEEGGCASWHQTPGG